MLCFYLISFRKLCGINLKIGRIYQKKSRFSIFLMTSSENGSHFEESFATILFLLYQRISVPSFKWIASLSEILARGVESTPASNHR